MPVAFDAVGGNTGTGGIATLSWTHTPIGTPTAIIVLTGQDATGVTVSGVTYNGVAMTSARTAVTSGDSELTGWMTTATPSTGAQTVVVTYSANAERAVGHSFSVTGSDATDPVGNTGVSTTAAQAVSASVTVASGALGIGFCYTANVQGGSMTENDTATTGRNDASGAAYGSSSYIAGSISSMAYTSDFSTNMKLTMALEIVEASAGGISTAWIRA